MSAYSRYQSFPGIDWILTIQMIPETLPEAALWRHNGLSEVVFVLRWSPYDEPQIKHNSGLHVVLAIGEWNTNANNFIRNNYILALNIIVY